jgi:hypothetical protein
LTVSLRLQHLFVIAMKKAIGDDGGMKLHWLARARRIRDISIRRLGRWHTVSEYQVSALHFYVAFNRLGKAARLIAKEP